MTDEHEQFWMDFREQKHGSAEHSAEECACCNNWMHVCIGLSRGERDFDLLVSIARGMLRNYPENSIVSNEWGDPGARFTWHLRRALRALEEPAKGAADA